jgi:imidazolonepropionase-like amidohydrolase
LEIDTAEGLRRAVGDQAQAGSDFIKVFVTGGNLTPGTDPFALQYTPDQLRAAVQAAHDVGLRVAAHAHAPEGIAAAVDARVDTIEHCLFETRDGVAYDPAMVERIAKCGIVVSPTVGNPPDLSADEHEAFLTAHPYWRRLEGHMAAYRRNFRTMFESGVTLAGGSDAGIARRAFGNYPRDVAAMADAGRFPVGLSPLDALRAATSVAAATCGLTDTGRLSPGMRADIVAVEGNPLVRIADLQQIRLVVCNGRVIVAPSQSL